MNKSAVSLVLLAVGILPALPPTTVLDPELATGDSPHTDDIILQKEI